MKKFTPTKKFTQALVAAFVLALSAGTIAHVTPAKAANVAVQFDAGNVAFGFSDGYWDRGQGLASLAEPASAYQLADPEPRALFRTPSRPVARLGLARQ